MIFNDKLADTGGFEAAECLFVKLISEDLLTRNFLYKTDKETVLK